MPTEERVEVRSTCGERHPSNDRSSFPEVALSTQQFHYILGFGRSVVWYSRLVCGL